ncbi:MAG: hypothetical protein GX619_07835 [Bacteroidales bacterium]|jgi:membrane-bound ClpP family serine protease|nr:hypothetical protein [Bacteroidales bacterium]OPZ99336.1 MAG: hypothetical protein BWY72_00408 [Bacteroidetes bacterium ADurb.Bin416]HBL72021.1 hypothetical protein [Bacteroidales bacterium]
MSLAFIIGLIVLGIFFLVIEVYLLPGISIAGIAGVACMLGGVVMAYTKLGPAAGTWILGVSIVALAIVLYWFYKSKTFDKMALKTDIESKTDPFSGQTIQPGDRGITLSRLAPIGKVQINETVLEGRSEQEMIDENTPIEVVEVGSYNVLVRKV